MVFTWQGKKVKDDHVIKKDHCSLTVACIWVGQTRTIEVRAKVTHDQLNRMREALSSRTLGWTMRQGNKSYIKETGKAFQVEKTMERRELGSFRA